MLTDRQHMRSVLVILLMGIALLLPSLPVSALNDTSLQTSDPRPGQTGVDYTLTSQGFTTGTTIRCIEFTLNTASDGSGSAVGTTTAFTLSSSSVITTGSWTTNGSTNGIIRITNTTGQTPAASGNIVFGNITNGAAEGTTYYGIFVTYTDVSCTGGNEVDQATVAYILKEGALVQLTVDPTLIFTTGSVAASQLVNGATTTVGSTAASINFQNNVTTVANGISAHDLNVSTNATNGYSVYIRHTGQLSNGTDTIANHTGTNATPTSFSAVGTESWGYTSEEAAFSSGTADRFTNPGNAWAGFTTTNEPVMENTAAATSTETVRVGHQVGIAGTTPAGTYQTTIIYTAASVY